MKQQPDLKHDLDIIKQQIELTMPILSSLTHNDSNVFDTIKFYLKNLRLESYKEYSDNNIDLKKPENDTLISNFYKEVGELLKLNDSFKQYSDSIDFWYTYKNESLNYRVRDGSSKIIPIIVELIKNSQNISDEKDKQLMEFIIVGAYGRNFYQLSLESGIKELEKLKVKNYEVELKKYIEVYKEMYKRVVLLKNNSKESTLVLDSHDMYSYTGNFSAPEFDNFVKKVNKLYYEAFLHNENYIWGFTRNFSREFIGEIPHIISKWQEISKMLDKNVVGFDNKTLKKVKTFLFKNIINIPKIQEKLIKESNKSYTEANNLILAGMPEYTKNIKTVANKRVYNFQLVEELNVLKIEKKFDLKKFANETGLSRTDLNDYIDAQKNMLDRIVSLNLDTVVFLEKYTGGFKFIINYEYQKEGVILEEEDFSKLLFQKVYENIISNISIIKKRGGSMHQAMYDEKTRQYLLLSEFATEISREIRSKKLVEKMGELNEENKNHVSRKKI